MCEEGGRGDWLVALEFRSRISYAMHVASPRQSGNEEYVVRKLAELISMQPFTFSSCA